MGISRLTAFTIAERDDLIYDSSGPGENGKYAGSIHMPNGRLLLNTTPVFNSPVLAIKHLFELKDRCKDLVMAKTSPQVDIKA
ncbi:MAG: hypothetical protein COA75_03480 [Cellvibrionales bacterium]|nr:MAG: hypothetical protein COA75_03480 [Cellvibrionales bacterium]